MTWTATDRWAPPNTAFGGPEGGAGRGRPPPVVREKEPWALPDAAAKQRPVANERWTGEGVSMSQIMLH